MWQRFRHFSMLGLKWQHSGPSWWRKNKASLTCSNHWSHFKHSIQAQQAFIFLSKSPVHHAINYWIYRAWQGCCDCVKKGTLALASKSHDWKSRLTQWLWLVKSKGHKPVPSLKGHAQLWYLPRLLGSRPHLGNILLHARAQTEKP